MSITAKPLIAPFWHEIKSDDGAVARFKLRPLKPLELFDVNAHAIQTDDGVSFTGAAIRCGLRAGVMEWDGVNDEQGNPLKLGKVKPDEVLSSNTMSELFYEILKASTLSGDQAKN